MATDNHHDVDKLPKWAIRLIDHLGSEIKNLSACVKRLESAHEILFDTESFDSWFTVPGPPEDYKEETFNLWYLSKSGALPVCSLRRGDLLLVGRRKKGS